MGVRRGQGAWATAVSEDPRIVRLPRTNQSATWQAEEIGLGDHEPNRGRHQQGANRPEEHGDDDADDEDREPHPIESHEGGRLGAATGEGRDGYHATNEGKGSENQDGRCTYSERWHVVSVGVGRLTEDYRRPIVSLGTPPKTDRIGQGKVVQVRLAV